MAAVIARAALVVVLAGVFGAAAPAGTCLAAAPAAGTAGVIVEYDEAHTSEFCVPVEPDARALDVLTGTGLDLTVEDYGGDRLTLCRIGGVGCERDDCFCSCRNAESGCTFWGVYTLGARGDWRFADVGVGELRVSPGEVLGLRWSVQTSDGGAAPLADEPRAVCTRVAPVAANKTSKGAPGLGALVAAALIAALVGGAWWGRRARAGS